MQLICHIHLDVRSHFVDYITIRFCWKSVCTHVASPLLFGEHFVLVQHQLCAIHLQHYQRRNFFYMEKIDTTNAT